MGLKHKISDDQSTKVKKKKQGEINDNDSTELHLGIPEDHPVQGCNDSLPASDNQTVKKKKARKIEPYWSTSKAFVAALQGEDKIGGVLNWFQAIHNEQKIGTFNGESDLTNGSAENSEVLQKDNTSLNDEEDSPEDSDSKREKTTYNSEKFGDVIAPYVDAFFRAGGTVSSLLACGRLEQSQLCTLFQALYHIMLRGNVLGEVEPSWIKGECIEFLRLNADTTRHLLSTLRSARQNQLTLDFLLAMTAIDNQVAIEVLGIADLKDTNVRHMASESTLEVRKAYINLITGLLVCGDPTLTRALLIRPYIVMYIIPSLEWDPADIVGTFLTAVRCHLVQDRSIRKVRKSEIFSGEIIAALLRLYRWGGPANRPATLAHISKKTKAKSARPFIEVDKGELKIVTTSVHSLLLILLSDHTLGLVYKDLSIGTKTQRNYLISHVFRYVDKPWNVPALGELFVRTLTANPDVIKSVLQSMKPALEPRPTKEWSKCLDLVEQVITGIHPEKLIEESLGELNLSHLMSVVVDLCVPQILVSVLCGANGSNLLGTHGNVTHRIAHFLSHMLSNLEKVYERMPDWREQGKLSQNDIMKVRCFVTEFLVRHFPVFSTLLKSCLAFMKASDEIKSFDDDTTASSQTSILKLLLVYLRLCSRDDSSVANADGENHKILMDMFDTLCVESDLNPYIRYDFYELLLSLKEPSFVLENESRREHVRKLFCDVLSSDENVSRRAKNVLVKLINNAALFEGNTHLPAIWIDIYRKYLEVYDVNFMIESVVRAILDPATYRRKIEKADGKTSRKMVESERLEESLNAQFDEVYFLFNGWEEEEPVVEMKGLCTVSYELNSISPWLPALLDVVREHEEKRTSEQLERRQEFLRHLLVTLLFYSTQPATLIRLVVKKYRRDHILPTDLVEYLKSWGSKGCPQPLFFRKHFISRLTKFLLVEDAQKLDDADFLRAQMRKTILEGKDEGASKDEVVYVARVIVFHIVELSKRAMLTTLMAERCGECLCAILAIAQELRGDVLRACVRTLLSNFIVLSGFSPSAQNCGASTQNLTSIVIKVLQKMSEFSEINNDGSIISALKEPFKRKLINALTTASTLRSRLHRNSAEAVVLFYYTFDEITKMLSTACEVDRDLWLESSEMGPTLSSWGIVAAHLLQVAADSKQIASLPDALVTDLSKKIATFNIASIKHMSALDKAFFSYLKFRPHQTKFLSKDLVPSIFANRSPSADCEHLAVWLCRRFRTDCLNNITNVLSSEDSAAFKERFQLLFESMKGAFSHSDFKKRTVHFESCASIVGKVVKNAVMDENQRPKWLASYVDFVVALLTEYKRFSVAKAALFSLLKTPPVVTLDKFFCVELIESLFWSVCGPDAQPPLVLLYLKWLTVSLQKQDKKEECVLLISQLCFALLKKSLSNQSEPKEGKQKAITWQSVIDSDTWMAFVPLALMFGLQPTYIENASKGVEARSRLLRALRQVCMSIFSYRTDNVQIATIFKLAIKHSEFQSCMTAVGPVRLELVKLLKLLIEYSPSLIEGDHFAMILSSYRATVEPGDRLILQLLDKYESAGVVPPLYKSFLWGQDGASVYATMNVKNSLEIYDTNRVFSLLSVDLVHQTILNFPLSRSLDVDESYDSSSSEAYDPAFYLPILSHVSSPESPLKTFAFVRSGALALTLVALASQVEDVRTMAYSILSGFVDHLYSSKGVQVDVLNRFMDSLRVGVASLIKKDGSSSPRLSSIVAIFLARTCMVICNPLAPMYTTLNTFLLSKVEINLQSVPEFLACMHSSTSDYRDQRTWMLDMLSSGLCTEMDFQLCLNNEIPIFRLLMDMLTSCVTDIETKVRILKVLTGAVALPSGASWLVFRYGLLAWLSSVCLFRFVKTQPMIGALVTLIQTVWQTLTQSENTELPIQTINLRISCQLLRFLLSFVPMLATMETKTTSAFLLTVHETYKAGYPTTSHLLSQEMMKSIIELSSSTLPQDVGIKCSSILKFGGDFLFDDDEDIHDRTKSNEAASNLESLTKTWVTLRPKILT